MAGPNIGTGIVASVSRWWRRSSPLAEPGRLPPAIPQTIREAAAHAYMTRYYAAVGGYSSLFSAEVAAALLKHQTTQGISGNIGEIGVLKGRSFIALALNAGPDDLCAAIDVFLWPENVLNVFIANCETYGVDMNRVVTIASDTRELTPPKVAARLNGKPFRYFHIDGDHAPAVLTNDLELAHELMAPGGIICLDDMLHAMYPELALTVHGFLSKYPEWQVFCIVDRADLLAASKYLICRAAFVELYQAALRESFPQYVLRDQAEFSTSKALILTKDTVLLPIYDALARR